MFFSLGVSGGGLIMYSSYNRFGNDVFRDAMIVSVLDTVTSIIAGLVIFSVLGAMAHELGVKVSTSAYSMASKYSILKKYRKNKKNLTLYEM